MNHSARMLCVGFLSTFLITAAIAKEVEIITVEEASSASLATISGTVTPFKEVTLTAQLPGRVGMVAGAEGDAFNQADVLVKLEIDDLLAKRSAAEAQLSNMQAAMKNAEIQYSRELVSPQSESLNRMPGMGMPTLFDNMFTKQIGNNMGYGNSGFERHADLYARATGINQAQAGVLGAVAQIRELDAKIRDSISQAPFDGIVLRKMVEVGDTVQPGMPLVTFGHLKYLRIRSEVPARLASQLRTGMLLDVRLDNGVKTKTRVAQVFPVADANNHTVTVKFDLPQGTVASPGMYAEIGIPAASDSAVKNAVIPKSALIKGRSLPAILLVTDEDTTSLRLLRLGQEVGDDKIIVMSGISPGQRIVDFPAPGARAGSIELKQAESESD